MIVVPNEAKGVNVDERRYPLSEDIPVTEALGEPRNPSQDLIDEVERNLRSWHDCLSQNAKEKLKQGLKDIKTQWERAVKEEKKMHANETVEPLTHQQILSWYKNRVNVQWIPEEMHITVRRVFEEGFVLDCPLESSSRIHEPKRASNEEWGFDARLLYQEGQAIDYPDKEILSILGGGIDYSAETPPISRITGPHPQALQQASVFSSQIDNEIEKGWVTQPLPRPLTLPFHIETKSLVLKRCGINWRLIKKMA